MRLSSVITSRVGVASVSHLLCKVFLKLHKLATVSHILMYVHIFNSEEELTTKLRISNPDSDCHF